MNLGYVASLDIQHRHSDGSWESLEPRSHHDPADHDPERDWANGQIFACNTCDEQIRVSLPEDPGSSESEIRG